MTSHQYRVTQRGDRWAILKDDESEPFSVHDSRELAEATLKELRKDETPEARGFGGQDAPGQNADRGADRTGPGRGAEPHRGLPRGEPREPREQGPDRSV